MEHIESTIIITTKFSQSHETFLKFETFIFYYSNYFVLKVFLLFEKSN